MKKPVIALGGILLAALLFFGITRLSSSNEDDTARNNSLIELQLPGLVDQDIRSISTQPEFDFLYEIAGDTLVIRPISLLIDGVSYTIAAEYLESSGQILSNSGVLLHTDDSLASELVNNSPIVLEGVSLYATDRHHFYALVTAVGVSEEAAKKRAGIILEQYKIPADSVEVDVIYSRGATEEGSEDPFLPVQ